MIKLIKNLTGKIAWWNNQPIPDALILGQKIQDELEIEPEHQKWHERYGTSCEKFCLWFKGEVYDPGDKVIIRDNQDTQFKVGTVKSYIPVTQANQPCPVVEIGGKEFVCFSILRPYSKELEDKLNTMNPKEQWNYLCPHNPRIQEHDERLRLS